MEAGEKKKQILANIFYSALHADDFCPPPTLQTEQTISPSCEHGNNCLPVQQVQSDIIRSQIYLYEEFSLNTQ